MRKIEKRLRFLSIPYFIAVLAFFSLFCLSPSLKSQVITKGPVFVKPFICYDLLTHLWLSSSQATIYGIFTEIIPLIVHFYRRLTLLRNGSIQLYQYRTCQYCGYKHCRGQWFFPNRLDQVLGF